MIEIEAPDGSIFEFPDGTPDETIDRVMRQELAPDIIAAPELTPAPAPSVAPDSASMVGFDETYIAPIPSGSEVLEAGTRTARGLDDTVRALASGATFGYADEIAAGTNAALGQGTYAENVAQERARDAAIPPALRVGGELAGGIGSAVAASPYLAAGAIGRGLAQVPRWMRPSLYGGTTGGLYSSGTATEGNRLAAVPAGVALGATGGAAIQGVSKVAPYAWQGIERGLDAVRRAGERRSDPALAARESIFRALQEGGVTPEKAAGRLARMGDRATLADVGGQNVRGIARGAVGVPGPGRQTGTARLETRARGEGARIGDAVKGTLSGRNLFEASDDALATMSNNARGLYDRAYSRGQAIGSERLSELMARVPASARREADELARLDGRAVPEVDAASFPTQYIDDVKRAMDDAISSPSHSNQMTGRVNNRGRAVNSLKNQILEEVDAVNPAYKMARDQYGGDAEVLQSLKMGQDFLKQAPEQIKADLAGLSDAAQNSYRVGVARAILNSVESVPDTASAANRLLNKKAMRDRLRAVFPSQSEFNEFRRALVDEANFSQTRNFVLSGSQTAPRQAEQQALLGPYASAAEAATTGTPNAYGSFISDLWNRLNAPNPNLAREQANLLFRSGPAAQSALGEITASQVANRANPIARDVVDRRLMDMLIRMQGQVGGSAAGSSR